MKPEPPTDDETIETVYRLLRLIRRSEEEIARLYPSDKIKSPIHLSIGQEFVSVGVIGALDEADVVSATYRGHAAYIAKGGDLGKMMAELYGKAGGCAGGKAGSMHLVDMEQGILGTSAVVATTIPVAVGYALALKREGRGRIVVSFFGDGATEEGAFAESLNFAALHDLPILFVCENNGYAIHSPIEDRWASPALCARVETYGIRTHRFTEGDVFALRSATEKACQSLRAGDGPVFIECLACRWREHVGPEDDFDAGYRDRAEMEPWLAND
ncbi:MAG: thiamine pyrophosphate-dependent dehydrogenase E1 component subunit alpha [Rhodospirillales bacterium]|jgi:pyruvate dehydrogenase E1 component alpha subunit|nr:thiamine pyrophosphate-dependent dehydrogenase E1 component subunit alpha [Rhodospirillales bacterium]